MRLLHLGDLHFGKRLGTLSFIEDQKYINSVILDTISEKEIDAVLIAGDVYDKSVPSEEAVRLLDDFLVAIAKKRVPVLMCAGNHDSVERLSFGDKLIEAADIYISPNYSGEVKKVVLSDSYGSINFFLLPFVRIADVRKAFPDEEINSYTDAIDVAIKHMDVDKSERNVILSHQFVTGAQQGGSEDEFYVGGTSNIDSWVYEVFDYTALGHIHRPQAIEENIRYCGSPIKFSFNEENQKKGLTIVDIKEKGTIDYEFIPLVPVRDFVTIKGKYDDVKKKTTDVNDRDIVRVILTDEDDVPNAYSNLCSTYPGLTKLEYDNRRTRNSAVADGAGINTELSQEELIANFYKIKNDAEMKDEEKEYITQLINDIWG